MRIIVGISGATGAILGVNLVRALRMQPDCEVHLIISEGAEKTFKYESSITTQEVIACATHYHRIDNLGAPVSSGSFKTEGMVVIPCSMKTLAGIVSGYSDNLLLRAADVCLKERRKVVLVPRELPFSTIHLENMDKAARSGCIICPPVMTFYNNPETIQDMINHLIGKIMMMFGLEFTEFKPWTGNGPLNV